MASNFNVNSIIVSCKIVYRAFIIKAITMSVLCNRKKFYALQIINVHIHGVLLFAYSFLSPSNNQQVIA